mmetsp:Transcript_18007/g.59312  ORF Transcript_18007/g.59312 Transcript_18007/m.59312 type:complete len:437 (-) Transcript_18007:114-1424(-)
MYSMADAIGDSPEAAGRRRAQGRSQRRQRTVQGRERDRRVSEPTRCTTDTWRQATVRDASRGRLGPCPKHPATRREVARGVRAASVAAASRGGGAGERDEGGGVVSVWRVLREVGAVVQREGGSRRGEGGGGDGVVEAEAAVEQLVPGAGRPVREGSARVGPQLAEAVDERPRGEQRSEGGPLARRAARRLWDVLGGDVPDVGVEVRDVEVSEEDDRLAARLQRLQVGAHGRLPSVDAVVEPLEVLPRVWDVGRHRVAVRELDRDGAPLVDRLDGVERDARDLDAAPDEAHDARVAVLGGADRPVRRVVRQQPEQRRLGRGDILLLQLMLGDGEHVWLLRLDERGEQRLALVSILAVEQAVQAAHVPVHQHEATLRARLARCRGALDHVRLAGRNRLGRGRNLGGVGGDGTRRRGRLFGRGGFLLLVSLLLRRHGG